jgi:hypothetical protein
MIEKRAKARTVLVVMIFEMGALAGILVALFTVPRKYTIEDVCHCQWLDVRAWKCFARSRPKGKAI